MLNSSSGALLNSITSSSLNGPRDIIFLDGGQTIVPTSYPQKKVYSYSRVNSSCWNETLVIDAGAKSTSTGSSHITVDECNWRWFSFGSAGALIYDKNGVYLDTYTISLMNNCFQVLFLDNYVMYASDYGSNKIFRVDPNIVC
jgi:hypothetical protein